MQLPGFNGCGLGQPRQFRYRGANTYYYLIKQNREQSPEISGAYVCVIRENYVSLQVSIT